MVLTVGDLRKQIENVPDDVEVRLISDVGIEEVDNGYVNLIDCCYINQDFVDNSHFAIIADIVKWNES